MSEDKNHNQSMAKDSGFDPQQENTDKELRILITDADKNGTDIAEMSDFIGNYMQEMRRGISGSKVFRTVESIPLASLGLIGEALRNVDVVLNKEMLLIPDFDSLPADIKEKLQDGIYRLGESRQVNGNIRAVIVDEAGTRVKDITLKEAERHGLEINIQSLAVQAQLHQIYTILNEVKDLQAYAVDMSRNQSILAPLLSARDYVFRAQEIDSEERRLEFLKDSDRLLAKAMNNLYADMRTTAKYLDENTARPVFQNTSTVQRHINYLVSDLQIASKFVGMQIQIRDYLKDEAGAKHALTQYERALLDVCEKPLLHSGHSAIKLLHNYYPYDDSNRNSWHYFDKRIRALPAGLVESTEEQTVYLLSIEDPTEEKDGE